VNVKSKPVNKSKSSVSINKNNNNNTSIGVGKPVPGVRVENGKDDMDPDEGLSSDEEVSRTPMQMPRRGPATESMTTDPSTLRDVEQSGSVMSAGPGVRSRRE
jgi:hypothetical protein